MTGSSGPSFSVSVELLLFGAGAVLTLVAAGIFALVIDNWHHSARRARRLQKRRRLTVGVDPVHRTASLHLSY